MGKKSSGIAAVTSLANWRESRGISSVHPQQVISGQVLTFPRHGRDNPRPRRRRDALALPPLAGDPVTHAQVSGHANGHFSGGLAPAGEYVGELLHGLYLARDGLSRQEVPRFPVPSEAPKSENRRMGRARSPVQFNKDFARRLVAARIAAGFDSGEDFAKALGVNYERYKKWESGRTPLPHEYIARAGELTGKDANYFYGLTQQQEQRKAG